MIQTMKLSVRHAQAFLAWLCLACLAILAGCTPSLDWRELNVEGSGVSALFPCRPENRVRQVSLAGMAVQMHLASCTASGSNFALSHLDAGDPVKADGSGSLSLTADGGAGPVTNASTGSILDAVVPPITPTKATNAVNVKVVAPATTSIMIGAPELTMTYSGSTPDGARPTRVFAQLVDDTTGLVLGNQITPIAVTLDGQPHTVTVPLEVVAFTAHPGTSVTLQLVATTVAYAQPRLGGTVDFSAITISIPTGTGITAR